MRYGHRFYSSYYYDGELCINDTGIIQSSGNWGNLSFLEVSHGSCLDPSAQFRFRENGAMLNIQRQGCLAAYNKRVAGYDLDMFYLYVDSVSLDTAACAQKPNESIYRSITQDPYGKLLVQHKRYKNGSFTTWCARRERNSQLSDNYGIQYYVSLSKRCGHHSYSDEYRFGNNIDLHQQVYP